MKMLIIRIIEDLKRCNRDPLYRNSYFLISNYFIVAILGFLFYILVARYYTPHDVGNAVALISVSNLLVTLSTPGLGTGIIRFLQNERDKSGLINSCFMITFLLSIIITVIFILGIRIWSPSLSFVYENPLFLLFFFIFIFMTAMVRLQGAIFIAMRSSKFSFFQNTVLSILKIIFVLFLVEYGALGIISSWSISLCIAFIISTFFFIPKIVKSYKPVPIINYSMIKKISNISLGNYIAENVGSIPGSIFPLMILNFLNSEMNAYFFMALNISNLLLQVPMSINLSLFAEGSFSPAEFRNNTIRAIKLIILSFIPIIFCTFIFGNRILLLYGQKYADNGFYILCVLALSLIPSSIRTLYATIKNVQCKVMPIIYLNAFLTMIEIVIIYLLIIKIGLIGVAIGILLAEAIGALIVITLAKKEGWIIGRQVV